jgi:hypothetical protein
VIEIVGAVVSCTVIVNVATVVLPLWSAAVHVTVFMPSANHWPDVRSHFIVGIGSTRSVAVGAVNVTAAPLVADVASAVIGAGKPTTDGPSVSTTVTVNA